MANNRLLTKLPRGVELKDPILLASGCCGYGLEYSGIFDPGTIGGVITKAVSFDPRPGNPTPRLVETPAGLMNCIGLQNPGIKEFCAKILPGITDAGFSYLVNVVGHTPKEFAQVIGYLEQQANWGDGEHPGFCGYELDLSCPNVESGTLFATDQNLLSNTVGLCRQETEAMIVAKLSPNVADIVPFASQAKDAGADAVTIANTYNAVSINIANRKSNLSRPSAGLSGPAIRAATLYHVWRCHAELAELPILASGGITDADSAIQYLLAGATALQVGTGLFLDPSSPLAIQQGLIEYIEKQGEESVQAIIGTYMG